MWAHHQKHFTQWHMLHKGSRDLHMKRADAQFMQCAHSSLKVTSLERPTLRDVLRQQLRQHCFVCRRYLMDGGALGNARDQARGYGIYHCQSEACRKVFCNECYEYLSSSPSDRLFQGFTQA